MSEKVVGFSLTCSLCIKICTLTSRLRASTFSNTLMTISCLNFSIAETNSVAAFI